LITGVQWQHTKLALTPSLDFFLLSEIATMQQTDGTAHKLKPRLFYKSTPLWAHLTDFHPWCELWLTIVSFKIDQKGTCKLLYKVIWLEYENTKNKSKWLFTTKLAYTVNLVADFHSTYSTKPSSFSLS